MHRDAHKNVTLGIQGTKCQTETPRIDACRPRNSQMMC